jgi:hypothetical protein
VRIGVGLLMRRSGARCEISCRLVSWGSTCICTPSFESASFINRLSHFLTATFESFQLVDRADCRYGLLRAPLSLPQSSETINDGGNGEVRARSPGAQSSAACAPILHLAVRLLSQLTQARVGTRGEPTVILFSQFLSSILTHATPARPTDSTR